MRTSVAHSCSVPTTGMSMFSCGDLSSLARRGMAPALRMACLFLVLLEHDQSARAPLRATSTSISPSADFIAPIGTQSSRPTWAGTGKDRYLQGNIGKYNR